ncbi:MAG: hypothetical protein LH478_07955 [Chitinophagaceae bacterium]|nr:hypothetical protein [Chitinophagaceae bacterium]
MKRNATLFSLLMLFIFSSCHHRYYTSRSFKEQTFQHKTIAILPPKMVLMGNMPPGYSVYEIEQLEIKESKLFQEALFNNILKSGNHGRHSLTIALQPFITTLSLLEKNEISIRNSWDKDDAELAAVLGVDAVVRTSIQKDRIMSDLASASIYAGDKIADAILKKPPLTTPAYINTSNIRATCSIVSKGETLWNDSYITGTNFSVSANEVIYNLTNNFAKNFPYKRRA